MGYGQPTAGALLGIDALDNNPNRMRPEVVPADQNFLAWELARNVARGVRGDCQFQTGIQRDFALAAITLADGERGAREPTPPVFPDDLKDKSIPEENGKNPFGLEADQGPPDLVAPARVKEKGKPEVKKTQPKDELPEEFVGQAIKHIVMHEVGHSLGLRHNFKASTMLKIDQLNDTTITHVKGLVGSVMDYSPINIAPKGKKQGDYYSTTIGPYDYWAIEYAYKPAEGMRRRS